MPYIATGNNPQLGELINPIAKIARILTTLNYQQDNILEKHFSYKNRLIEQQAKGLVDKNINLK